MFSGTFAIKLPIVKISADWAKASLEKNGFSYGSLPF